MNDTKPDTSPELFTGQIGWDNATITREAERFPEALRVDYIWLKTCVRVDFDRSVRQLTEELIGQGVEIGIDVWQKILRGLWDRYAKGVQREKPLLSPREFTDAVAILRKRIAVKAGLQQRDFVFTTTAERVFNYILKGSLADRPNGLGLIVGDTGTQKTASLVEFAIRYNHGTTLYRDMPENGSRVEMMQLLCDDMSAANNAYKLSAHLLQHAPLFRRYLLDNCQHLVDPDRKANQKALSFIRRLQDSRKGYFFLSFTPDGELEAARLGKYWEQFIGRAGGPKGILRLDDFAPRIDLIQIAAARGLGWAKAHVERLGQMDPGPKEDRYRLGELKPKQRQELEYLTRLSRQPGRIRPYFETLWQARLLAEGAPLTFEHIRDVGGDPDEIKLLPGGEKGLL